ncbi:bifunctional diguanylate cyclase/phosphodiesterase [Hyphomicrobium sp. ghe19]|uniref:putative bifunctional diguanylate cyclase/phosphodiesterase n=1 Tax=Hyphomicrobium sp. ghe19 TaxID=2682968 RepID=UPI001366F57C|nr:putative signaling protein [Hyphomicrobium sp. ghe19]
MSFAPGIEHDEKNGDALSFGALRRDLRLTVEQELASTILSCTHEAVIITDASGSIISANAAFSRITGYSADDIRNQNMRVLQSGMHPKSFYEAMWNCLKANDCWHGEIWNRKKNGDIYPALLTINAVRSESGELTHYVGSSADLTPIKSSQRELERRAQHDDLTGLPNRRLLTSRLDQALARANAKQSTGAVIFVGLDRFKLVNDSLGHSAGDEVLIRAAERLSSFVRTSDMVARFGGDEFGLLCEGTPRSTLGDLVSRILDQLCQPYFLSGGRQVWLGASAGISLFPDDGRDAASLIQYADAALYHAKCAGKGTYRFFSTRLTEAANTRLSADLQLRQALAREEFILHYQPLVSMPGGKVTGLEALVRWKTANGKVVPPGDFIPAAEETGLIVPLGEWVLRTACRDMKELLAGGADLKTMAVNVSAQQLHHAGFVDTLQSILKEFDLNPSVVELEITEGTLMGQGKAPVAILHALKALGLRLAIDDFGTGYSSLAYLQKLPIDKLKIDRSFVSDLESGGAAQAIAAAIIGLGRSLRLEVLAEGVENRFQLDFLVNNGCREAQGYYFGLPIPKEALPALGGIKWRREATSTRRADPRPAAPYSKQEG